MDIETYLLDLESALLDEANWQEIELTRLWTATILQKACA